MLKKQHFELLKLIENEKKLSKIAELLNLTERSVRYKIDEINEELGSKKIEIKKREFFSSMTENDMDKLFENIESRNYIYSKKEREELIILYTLMKKDKFLLSVINSISSSLPNFERTSLYIMSISSIQFIHDTTQLKVILLILVFKRIVFISILFTPNLEKTSILGSIIICLLFILIFSK